MLLFFIILPACTFAFAAWSIRRGKIRVRSRLYVRSKDPKGFWIGIGVLLFLGTAMLFPLWDQVQIEFHTGLPTVSPQENSN